MWPADTIIMDRPDDPYNLRMDVGADLKIEQYNGTYLSPYLVHIALNALGISHVARMSTDKQSTNVQLSDGASLSVGHVRNNLNANPLISAQQLLSQSLSVSNGSKTSLSFPTNNTPNSNIRIVWSGANLLPRVGHTVIWAARHVQQTGYYAVFWHAWNDGAWHASDYEFGTHPHPCDGAFDGEGQRTNGTGAAGTVHYDEIAGLGAKDIIGYSDLSGAHPTTKGSWIRQARTTRYITVSTLNDTIEHVYCPDLSDPSKFMRYTRPASGLPSPPSPAFYLGCSDWTASGSTNEETAGGSFRGLQFYSAYKSLADCVVLSNLQYESAIKNHPLASSLFYLSLNPKPSDISDHSGFGHHPVYANANVPNIGYG